MRWAWLSELIRNQFTEPCYGRLDLLTVSLVRGLQIGQLFHVPLGSLNLHRQAILALTIRHHRRQNRVVADYSVIDIVLNIFQL